MFSPFWWLYALCFAFLFNLFMHSILSFKNSNWVNCNICSVSKLINAEVWTGCLDPEEFKEFKLVKRTQLSHNVAEFKFALPTPTSVLGLPIGQHMSCRFDS